MKQIINVSLIACTISIGLFLLLCLSSAGVNASLVQFSTTGGISAAGDGPQQIVIERIGDTDNESMNVSVIVLNTSLNCNEYEFSPVEFYWAPGDNSSRVMNVTITTNTADEERETVTFGLCKIDGGGDLGDPARYEMVIEFPGTPIETPKPSVTETPGTTISNASPTLTVPDNATNATAIASVSTSPSATVGNDSTNMTAKESSNAQDMPIVLFGGVVSLVVIITAAYLMIFKRN